MNAGAGRPAGKVRCAIYTRKSSEEGLEQDFNSLDAQREACGAYILSQASEGWSALPDIYDDGGLSGGTLVRPALQRLLGEVAAGRVDIIVVYKVDRLTRSLLDFSKLLEAFDTAGVSFVSVTQSFNTTTSMGRLTLNMLLSFAQFEREVTAERIRDKIAASKAKGMWMGGTPPLGYRPDGRSLAIVDEHAALIRDIFARYLELGNVRLVKEAFDREGIVSPPRERASSGAWFGGRPFARGQLYTILRNPIYIGDIAHKQQRFKGSHPPIIERAIWERVRTLLAANCQGQRSGVRTPHRSLLAGKVIGPGGVQLIASHASKGNQRYRYYCSPPGQAAGQPVIRMPALELERAVCGALAEAIDDPLNLAAQLGIDLALTGGEVLMAGAATLAARVRGREHDLVRELVKQVELTPSGFGLVCDAPALGRHVGTATTSGAVPELRLTAAVRLSRSGRALRLVTPSGTPVTSAPDTSLIKLVVRARAWWRELARGDVDVKRFAAREGVTASYMTRVLRLAFLSPAVVEAIVSRYVVLGIDAASLTSAGVIPPAWAKQKALICA